MLKINAKLLELKEKVTSVVIDNMIKSKSSKIFVTVVGLLIAMQCSSSCYLFSKISDFYGFWSEPW